MILSEVKYSVPRSMTFFKKMKKQSESRTCHTVVKKYGTIEPKSEVTIGQADAIPVFDTAYRNIYVRTDAQDWD